MTGGPAFLLQQFVFGDRLLCKTGKHVHSHSACRSQTIRTGEKLTMQELRIVLVLFILNFEFLPLPKELNSRLGHQEVLRAA